MNALAELKRDLESELATQRRLPQSVSVRWLVDRLTKQIAALDEVLARSEMAEVERALNRANARLDSALDKANNRKAKP